MKLIFTGFSNSELANCFIVHFNAEVSFYSWPNIDLWECLLYYPATFVREASAPVQESHPPPIIACFIALLALLFWRIYLKLLNKGEVFEMELLSVIRISSWCLTYHWQVMLSFSEDQTRCPKSTFSSYPARNLFSHSIEMQIMSPPEADPNARRLTVVYIILYGGNDSGALSLCVAHRF